ncbi:MAG TPA: hypothetical protein VIF62_24565 [Labilithrix sp.]
MEISGSRSTDGHHFSDEEEDALRHERGSGEALATARERARLGGEAPTVRGDDRTLREVRSHQKEHIDSVEVGGEGAHFAVETLHVAGAFESGAAAGATAVALPVGAFALGVYGVYRAVKDGEEQKEAIAKDQVHVALVANLDLPAPYKMARNKQYTDVGRDFSSSASKIADAIRSDPKLAAQLQLQADRGTHAALDFVASGKPLDAWLKDNPKIASLYAQDPAFHEGFTAIEWASRTTPAEQKGLSPAEIETVKQAKQLMLEQMKRGIEQRDGWYAQAAVNVRV